MQYSKEYKKGQLLDKDFNEFITGSLMEVTTQNQEGIFIDDIIIRFKKPIKLTVTIKEL